MEDPVAGKERQSGANIKMLSNTKINIQKTKFKLKLTKKLLFLNPQSIPEKIIRANISSLEQG